MVQTGVRLQTEELKLFWGWLTGAPPGGRETQLGSPCLGLLGPPPSLGTKNLPESHGHKHSHVLPLPSEEALAQPSVALPC